MKVGKKGADTESDSNCCANNACRMQNYEIHSTQTESTRRILYDTLDYRTDRNNSSSRGRFYVSASKLVYSHSRATLLHFHFHWIKNAIPV
jgi:hypothetical protein